MKTKFRNGACPEYEALIEDFLEGDLGGREAKNLAEHLNRCSGCRAALDETKGSRALLRMALPTPDPGPGFPRIVMARIRASQERAAEEGNFWRPFVALAWRFAATAALVVAALMTYDIKWSRASQPEIVVAQQAEPRDIFSPNTALVPASRDEVLIMVADVNHGNH